jgi:hypothetical protein
MWSQQTGQLERRLRLLGMSPLRNSTTDRQLTLYCLHTDASRQGYYSKSWRWLRLPLVQAPIVTGQSRRRLLPGLSNSFNSFTASLNRSRMRFPFTFSKRTLISSATLGGHSGALTSPLAWLSMRHERLQAPGLLVVNG